MSRRHPVRPLACRWGAAAGLVAALAAPAGVAAQQPSPPPTTPPQAVIKVSEDVFFRFGVLIQGWADFLENPAIDDYTQELYLRRMRVLFGGQVAKGATFFFEIDGPNIGRGTAPVAGGGISPKGNTAIRVQDAVVSFNYAKDHFIDGGLILTPLCHNCVSSATALLPLDYAPYSFLNTGPLDLNVGRDYGFQARGYLGGNRFEYRVAAFSGLRDATRTNPLRGLGRLQVSLLEPGTRAFYYPNFFLTPKRVLDVGAAADVQSDYKAFSGDAFFSYPLGATQLNGTAQVIYYDGDGFLGAALPEQTTYYAEAGLYFAGPRLMPFGSIGFRRFDDDLLTDTNDYQLGFTYYFRGNNANFRAAWRLTDPRVEGVEGTNNFTGQLQVFFY
jgi:hypothetical protein